MTEKQLVKLAEEELEQEKVEKQKQLIKDAIKQTLERIEELDNEIKEKQRKKKILKQDIDNIRAGRLDLIEERQKKNGEAGRTSVIRVEKVKEVHHYYDHWYEPYRIYPLPDPYPYIPQTPIWCSTADCGSTLANDSYMTITSSMAKDVSCGTYKLDSGTVLSFT